jgi:hypothetical protein
MQPGGVPRIVGYGLCGPNEPYLEETLKEFKRLCDDTIICLNHATKKEKDLIQKYGFHTVEDEREWGVLQWKIKEDFVSKHVANLKPDMCVCLDMDEVFDKNLTKEGLYELYKNPFEAFYFYIINLWDDGYMPARSFWNIRAWKWNTGFGTKWPHKNLHCGLAPEWTWARAFYAPYILKHYGLMDKERREKKAKRYDKYDPKARFMAEEYYESLRSCPQPEEFDEDKLHQEVVDYVHEIKQKYTFRPMQQDELVYIKTPNGETAPVPKNKLQDYLKQGCEFVGAHKELEDTLDDILSGNTEPVATEPTLKVEEREEEEERYICGQCGKEFDDKRKLHGHKMGAHKHPLKRLRVKHG